MIQQTHELRLIPAIDKSPHQQAEIGESAAVALLALNPDFPCVSLDEPLRNSQPEAHAGGSSVQPHELFKNPLVVLGRDPSTRIRDANFHAIRTTKPNPSPLFHRRNFRHTPLPEVRTRAQCHDTARRRVFQRVVKKILRRLLYLLIIESKRRYRRIQKRFRFYSLPLEGFGEASGYLLEAISEIIFPQLEYQLPALQCREV